MFVTQVFIRVPPKIDPAQAARARARAHRAVRPVHGQRAARRASRSSSPTASPPASRATRCGRARRKQLDALGAQYARVGSVITAVARLDTVDGKAAVGDYKADDIGIGIAQGTHPEIGENAIWIVVLMAERLAGGAPTVAPSRRRTPRAREHRDVERVGGGVERLAIDRRRDAGSVAPTSSHIAARTARRTSARQPTIVGDSAMIAVTSSSGLRVGDGAEAGGHHGGHRAVVEHDRARRDRAVAAADLVDRGGGAREPLEQAHGLGGRQVRAARRRATRRTAPRTPPMRVGAIEAERALHERALRAAEQARALERARRPRRSRRSARSRRSDRARCRRRARAARSRVWPSGVSNW